MSEPQVIMAGAVFQLLMPPVEPAVRTGSGQWSFPVPISVQLRFDSADPFAVHLCFTTGPSRDVTWVFARSLLTDGLLYAVGEGDVRVRPCDDSARDVVVVELSSPSGHAYFEASASTIADFLDQSFALVAPGAESDLVDHDAALAALLATDDR